jgi:hypothetical protein
MTGSTDAVEFLTESDPGGAWIACAAGHGITAQGCPEGQLRASMTEAVICPFDDGEAPKAVRLLWPGAGDAETVAVFLPQ